MATSSVVAIAGVLSIFSLLTMKEIIFPVTGESDPQKLDTLKRAAAFTGPTVKIMYW